MSCQCSHKLTKSQREALVWSLRRDGRVTGQQRTLDVLKFHGLIARSEAVPEEDKRRELEMNRDADVNHALNDLKRGEWQSALNILLKAAERQRELDRQAYWLTPLGRVEASHAAP